MFNIELQLGYIFSFFGFQITNTFFTSLLVTITLMLAAIFFYIHKDNSKNAFIKMAYIVVFELLNLTDSVTNNRNFSKKVLPVIATLLLFIVVSNLFSILPGFLGSFYLQTSTDMLPIIKSPNSDLTITLALALFSVFSIQFFSLQALGPLEYLGRFINFSSPFAFILGLFEIISEVVKTLSFSFRLFGNIFAGDVLLLVTASLIPYIIPLPFMLLEVFVGIIQGFIFAILTLTFIKISTIRHINIESS